MTKGRRAIFLLPLSASLDTLTPVPEDLGPITPYLTAPDVSEIMVNGPQKIFIEQAGKIIQIDRRYNSEMDVQRVVRQLLAVSGKNLSPQQPLMDLRLADGSRMTISTPPVTASTTFTIRKPAHRSLDINELAVRGAMSPEMAELLKAAVQMRLNLMIAGGTSTGKTTLLNALAALIPRMQRIVTIEDTYEISLPHPNWVAMETVYQGRGGGDVIDMRELVAHALHLRPDRILLGECRGGEALDILQAMSSGHDGSMATIHASTPQDVLSRLETLVLMAGYEIPLVAIRQQISRAVNIIVQMRRTPEGTRQINAITEVSGYRDGAVVLNDIYLLARDRQTGKLGYYATGYTPAFMGSLRSQSPQPPSSQPPASGSINLPPPTPKPPYST
jgi:pilus assembly protein CpaF